MATCMLTGKRPSAGNNKPKTLHKTRRMFKPNIQKFRGLKLSTHAIRMIKRAERVMMEQATPAAQ
jgi:ribosomal protein L28